MNYEIQMVTTFQAWFHGDAWAFRFQTVGDHSVRAVVAWLVPARSNRSRSLELDPWRRMFGGRGHVRRADQGAEPKQVARRCGPFADSFVANPRWQALSVIIRFKHSR